MSQATECGGPLFEPAGHRTGRTRAFNAVGWLLSRLGRYEEAASCYGRAAGIHRVSRAGTTGRRPCVRSATSGTPPGDHRSARTTWRRAGRPAGLSASVVPCLPAAPAQPCGTSLTNTIPSVSAKCAGSNGA